MGARQATPWSRVTHEKPVITQLIKKFPSFNGTRSFIAVFTRARQVRRPV